MAKNIFSKGIIDVPFKDFLGAMEPVEGESLQLIAQEARLIPVGKKDDEMSMTSVFLSGMKYVKEFRNLVSEPVGLSKTGSIYCYTEVSFPVVFDSEDTKNNRFDGLVLIVSGGKIRDAAIFEMKQGKNKVEKEQIERYLELAKKLHIPRLISISNQFVSKPTDYPISINIPKKNTVSLYHYSWKSILFFSQVLLMKNNLNIADVDQNNIMYEIFNYLNDCSGVSSFDSMTVARWKEIAVDLASETLKNDYKPLLPTLIRDWIQEEKDLALKLSLILSEREYTPVQCDKKKYTSMDERIKDEVDILQQERRLYSIFRIQNAVSPLTIIVGFMSKMIRLSMTVAVPTDKKPLGRVAFIRKYVKKAFSSDTGINDIQKHVYITLKSKKKKEDNLKYSLKEFLNPEGIAISKDFDFTSADVIMDYDLGKDIQSSSKFISILEDKVILFYTAVMQYFEKWTPSTPKADARVVINENTASNDSEDK